MRLLRPDPLLLALVSAAFAVAPIAVSPVLASTGLRTEAGAAGCDRYAAVWGINSNPGTFDAPYRTINQLLARLAPGQTGCVFEGVFDENVSMASGGLPDQPITLSGISVTGGVTGPGREPAVLHGLLSIPDSVNDVVFENLTLDGVNENGTPSPQVNGDRITFRGDDVTNENTAICFVLGGSFEDYGRANQVVIERSRIHHCGRLPASGHDHGIYVEGASKTRIIDSAIYANADWGIHLYPDAYGSYIAYNVIDGNGAGLIFAGEHATGDYRQDYSSDNNVVERNIISNSSVRYNVESWWGGPVGFGNVALDNCYWNGHLGDLDTSHGGFVDSDHTIADPLFVDRDAYDFRLQPGSPCAGSGPRGSGSQRGRS